MAYSPEYFTARESWRDWKIEARELIRLARVTRGSRVLEMGCGGGGLLRMLRERGAWVVGVDSLDVALELASTSLRAERSNPQDALEIASQETLATTQTPSLPRAPAPQLNNNPRSSAFTLAPHASAGVRVPLLKIAQDNHLPFANNSFDAIIGQHVIEHIADTNAALREWKRVLKPGGRLALATPNARYPDPAHFADADHARIFSPDELRDALTRVGWHVEACATIFPLLARTRAARGIGILAHKMFQHAPYFSSRGRTILISARG